MKKLILFLATGITVVTASAQENNSLIFRPQENFSKFSYPGRPAQEPKPSSTGYTAAKNTNGGTSWFCFQDARKHAPTTINTFWTTQDSAIYIPQGTPNPFYWWCLGLGTSFDPTSYAFVQGSGGGFVNATPIYPVPPFVVSSSDAYTIDSVTFGGTYQHIHQLAGPDTLIVDFFVAGSANAHTYLLHYLAYAGFIPIDPVDSQIFFACGSYKPFYGGFTTDSIPSGVQTWVHILSDLDTSSSAVTFTIPITLSANAGDKIVAFQHFRSYQQYSPSSQTSLDSINCWLPLCYAVNGSGAYPTQKPQDYNCGLIASKDVYYGDDSAIKHDMFMSNFIPTSTYAYGPISSTSPLYIQDPFFAFHLSCSSCGTTPNSVPSVQNIVGATEVYPNPATSNLSVEFNISKSATVNVSLINMLGQVVATQNAGALQHNGLVNFNVSSLPSGVYFYTIDANGERSTGRVVVAH